MNKDVFVGHISYSCPWTESSLMGIVNGQDRVNVRSNTEGTVVCVCNTISYDLLWYMGAPWRVWHEFISSGWADRSVLQRFVFVM